MPAGTPLIEDGPALRSSLHRGPLPNSRQGPTVSDVTVRSVSAELRVLPESGVDHPGNREALYRRTAEISPPGCSSRCGGLPIGRP